MSDVAIVTELPDCDFCKQDRVTKSAEYDAKTIQGPWANMCQTHFEIYSVSCLRTLPLGTGIGQRLILKERKGL